jgi:hypothetical protein
MICLVEHKLTSANTCPVFHPAYKLAVEFALAPSASSAVAFFRTAQATDNTGKIEIM